MRFRFIILAFALSQLLIGLAPGPPEFNPAFAQDAYRSARPVVRVGVLGLFHPHEITVSAPPGKVLVVRAGNETIVLEGSYGFNSANLRLNGSGVTISSNEREVQSRSVVVAGRNNEPVDVVVSIPGKITRHYFGVVEIRLQADALTLVVTMDREIAVASVILAESAPDAPLEALKAQAIATRSYLIAGRGRHLDFDFCDTTHCQFLREPPLPGSTAAQAAAQTRGLVLSYDSQPFSAMYTRSCGGRTRTPAQVGLVTKTYPYYSVDCEYCLSHPSHWTARLSNTEAQHLRHDDEAARLNVNRRLGWETIPSNDFASHRDGDSVVLQGIGNGHGVGLCQSGAKGMAERGASYQEILRHYYPNTMIIGWPDSPNDRERAASEAHLN
jgi:peptidoglycan hydrolase-like amidase